MQMMTHIKFKDTGVQTAQKEWLYEAVMETFTTDEIQQMLNEKREMTKKPKRSKKVKFGIGYGLPEGYDML